MPIGVAAFAEEAAILLRRKLRVVVVMRRRKFSFASEVEQADRVPKTYCNGAGLPKAPPVQRQEHIIACAGSAGNAIIVNMATLTIRRLDETTKSRLRIRAAHHGRSMEEEAREILRSTLNASPAGKGSLATAIRKRFAAFRGVELQLPNRGAIRRVPDYSE